MRCPEDTEGRIVAPLGRHQVNRKKMAIAPSRGKYAASNWRILECFVNGWCLAEIRIETGRTHQIRVHMSSIRCPVVGDKLYGGGIGRAFPIQASRQMLHAVRLGFSHPSTGKRMIFDAPLWPDMQQIVDTLQREKV